MVLIASQAVPFAFVIYISGKQVRLSNALQGGVEDRLLHQQRRSASV